MGLNARVNKISPLNKRNNNEIRLSKVTDPANVTFNDT